MISIAGMPIGKNLSFHARVFWSCLAAMLGLLFLFDLFFIHSQRQVLISNIDTMGERLIATLADNLRLGVFSESEALVFEAVEPILKQEDVLEIAVYSRDNRLLFRNVSGRRPAGPPDGLATVDSAAVLERLRLSPTPFHQDEGGRLIFWAPVLVNVKSESESLYLDTADRPGSGALDGYVMMVMDKAVLDKGMRALWRDNAILVLAFIALSFLATTIISRQVRRPLTRLISQVRDAGMPPGAGADEMGILHESFSSMLTSLAKAFETISSLKVTVEAKAQEVRDRNLELEEANRKLATTNEQLAGDILRRRQAELQVQILTQQLIRTQEQERQRIAYDLHDNVAQELSSLKIAVETLFDDHPETPPGLRERRRQMAGILMQCIGTVRELAHDMRQPDDLRQKGVVKAIRDYAWELTEKNRLTLDFSATGIDNLDLADELAINLFRLAQEGLRNIVKHAAASRVTIRMVASNPNIIMRIEDDGRGFNVEKRLSEALCEKRLGLKSMEERTRLLNGCFTLGSEPGRGVRILIEIPWS